MMILMLKKTACSIRLPSCQKIRMRKETETVTGNGNEVTKTHPIQPKYQWAE